jgi:hypothetical protein
VPAETRKGSQDRKSADNGPNGRWLSE